MEMSNADTAMYEVTYQVWTEMKTVTLEARDERHAQDAFYRAIYRGLVVSVRKV